MLYKRLFSGSLIFWVGIIVFTTACKKAGSGGDASVALFVKHHGNLIPAAKVYVKYNSKEFPGSDVTKYDLSVVCGSSGHSAGHAHLKNLRWGDYYFYSEGFDSTISQKVTGGIALQIRRSERKKEITLDIPVTE